ncbi:unnamed protein product [Oikopleura dioica]|uniref:Uncharacterized protein n=1 Tax=Oikopleura dioica TaxID=34765 RepID=E4Y7H4_OIKDI|nr:unnamed protein product [Oikopleura dioica]
MDIFELDDEFQLMINNDKSLWSKILPLVADLETTNPKIMRLKMLLPKVQNCDHYLNYWNLVKTTSCSLENSAAGNSDLPAIENNNPVSIEDMTALSNALLEHAPGKPDSLPNKKILRLRSGSKAAAVPRKTQAPSRKTKDPPKEQPQPKRFRVVSTDPVTIQLEKDNTAPKISLPEKTTPTTAGLTDYTRLIFCTDTERTLIPLGPDDGANFQEEHFSDEENDKDIKIVSEFVNVKGSDEVPFLVAILLNGTNPRFCLNVNGFLRSCRPCHINTSNLEVLLFCTRGREGIQCRGKHKLQILKKEMVVREKGPKGRSKLKLNTSRPDLIYNKKYYRTIPYFASEHTCEHPIAFRSVKAVKDGEITIRDLLPSSRKNMKIEEQNRVIDCKTEIIDLQQPLSFTPKRPVVDNRCRPKGLPLQPYQPRLTSQEEVMSLKIEVTED